MILPKFTLLVCGEGGERGRLCLFMVLQGKILKDDFYRLFISLEHLLEKWRDLATVRSLKVRKNGDLHRSVGLALHWAAGIVYTDDMVYG